MLGRIVEIAEDGCALSLDRGFLVRGAEGERGRTPVDDVAALIGNAHGLSYSNNLLVALAERSIPFVLCASNHAPVGLLWPVAGHHRQGARMDGQLRATLPLRKRLWKQLVARKIEMQAAVLDFHGEPGQRVRRLVAEVRAGDPGNVEGRAAAAYWPLVMGPRFRRDRHADGANSLLNYGYTVLRATVARHLMAAGLHPGIPLHHGNEGNAMRLVDDLMEPFRPLVDAWVRRLVAGGADRLDRSEKRALALLPIRLLVSPRGVGPVTVAIQRLTVSLAQIYEGQRSQLELPVGTVAALARLFDEPGSEIDETTPPAP